MKRPLWVGIMCVVVCLIAGLRTDSILAQSNPTSNDSKVVVPRLIRFTGTLRDASSKPMRGVAELSFSLFKEESGGEPLWFETQTVEVDAQGRYNVLLGAMHPEGLPMDLFTSGEARWLSIMVGKVEQPRVLLVSVPYALKAGDAESLGGKPATAYVASDQLKTQVEATLSESKYAQRTLNTMVMASTGTTATPALVAETSPGSFTCNAAGNCLSVDQSGAGMSLMATATSNHAIQGWSKVTSGTYYGVYGRSDASNGRGVYGYATPTTGTTFGVRGETEADGGYGVYGYAKSTTGFTFGVRGDAMSPNGRGVYGYARATTGVNYGVIGWTDSTSGVGLSGQATQTTGATMGIRAVVNSPAGTAAVIDGLGGGKLISARTTGSVEKFSVAGNGNVAAAGAIAAAGAAFSGPVTAPSFAGNGAGLTNVAAASATNTDTVDGFHAAAFQPAGTYATLGANTFSGVQSISGQVTATGSTTTSNSAILHATQTGSGIVDVTAGNYPPAAIRGDSTALSGGAYGVLGTAATDDAAGVAGVNTGGVGVFGYGLGTNGLAGVVGWCEQTSPSCIGIGSFLRMQGKLFEGRVAADAGDDGGVTKFTVDSSGNVVASGGMTAASFTGNGSALTNLSVGQITGAATLGSNVFVGGQSVTGDLTLSGSLNSGLKIEMNASSPNLIGGHAGNYITTNVVGATIGGGGIAGTPNRVTDDFGTVGGGTWNRAGDEEGTTGDQPGATVGGGYRNVAGALYATVSGGSSNTAGGYGSIGGGDTNVASYLATVGGGYHNNAGGVESVIGGGTTNVASGHTATVPGGSNNTAQGYFSFAAGYRAKALHDGSFVWGDYTLDDVSSAGTNQFVVRATGGAFFSNNLTAGHLLGDGSGITNVAAVSAETAATATNALALGGTAPSGFATVGSNSFAGNQSVTGNLTITGSINSGLVIQSNATSPNLLGGHSSNSITSGTVGGTIGGGGTSVLINSVTDNYGTVGGGSQNQAGDNAGTTADKNWATVGGGTSNKAGGQSSTVGGGNANTASGQTSTIGGGTTNTASASYSTIAGGYLGTASAQAATIGGGWTNDATGSYATVPGGASNSAAGMFAFAAGYHAKANHNGAFVWGDSTATDVASTAVNQFIVRAAGGIWLGTSSSPSWPASSFIATSTGAYLSTGGTWTNSSDRSLKEDFAAIDAEELLSKLIALPMQSWRYKAESMTTRHVGPTAQDFFSAFGLGGDDKHIATVDADGVALAAIQALYKNSLEKDERIVQLTEEVEELRARLASLEKAISNSALLSSVR